MKYPEIIDLLKETVYKKEVENRMELEMDAINERVVIDGEEYHVPKPVVHLLLKSRHELNELRSWDDREQMRRESRPGNRPDPTQAQP